MKLFERLSPGLNAIVISLGLLLWLVFFPLAALLEALGFRSEINDSLSGTISRLLVILWAWSFLRRSEWGGKICRFQFHQGYLAWIFVVYAFLQLDDFFNLWSTHGLTIKNGSLFVTEISLQIVTAAVEEFIFRGVILLAFLKPCTTYQATYQDILRGVIISSLAFGLSHMINLLALHWTIVLPMVIFTTFFGVALAALLLRTHSLWLCIGCHALLNVSGEIAWYLGSSISVYPAELPVTQILGMTLFTIPALVYGLWLLRKPSLMSWSPGIHADAV